MRYEIPLSNLPSLQRNIARLAKRAAKLGVEAPTLNVTGSVFRDDPTVSDLVRDALTPKIEYVVIEVDGKAPKYAGWTFRATLAHTDEGNILRSLPTESSIEIPTCYRTSGPKCDHCGHNRRRNDTYVVQSEAGEFKQVGSSCLRDFLGHADPSHLAQQAEWISDLMAACEEACEDREPSGGRRRRAYSVYGVVTRAAAAIRTYGWVSRANSRESGRTATADIVLSDFNPLPGCTPTPIVEADEVLASKAIDYIRATYGNREDLNDFEWNLRTAVKNDYTEERGIGLACYIAQAWIRHVEAQNALAASAAESKWVGEVGKRLRGMHLKVTFRHNWETAFGVTYLTKFVDSDGCVFVWKGSSPVDEDEVTLTGTVVEHDTFNGVKQTVLKRCKVEAVPAVEQTVQA